MPENPAVDAAYERARVAFEALPQARRVAIQEALVWTGDYRSNVDGGFGRMTRAALSAWAQRRGGKPDEFPSVAALDALIASGVKARTAAGYRAVSEPRSGVTIGLPTRVFPRRVDTPNGARFETTPPGALVETFRHPQPGVTLQQLYERMSAVEPGRRISYKVLRPDFFVIVVESGERVAYTRVAQGQNAGAPQLRGFTLSYPRAQRTRFEPLAVVLSNGFAPFGGAHNDAGDAGAAKVAQQAGPRLAGPALSVTGTRFLVWLGNGACPGARIGAAPARPLKHDTASGYALFDAPSATTRRFAAPISAAKAGDDLLALFATQPQGAPARGVEIAAAPGAAIGADAGKLRAYMPADVASAFVFNRRGDLVGVASGRGDGARPPGGLFDMRSPTALAAFLTASGVDMPAAQPSAPERSAGEIAAAARDSLAPLWCER